MRAPNFDAKRWFIRGCIVPLKFRSDQSHCLNSNDLKSNGVSNKTECGNSMKYFICFSIPVELVNCEQFETTSPLWTCYVFRSVEIWIPSFKWNSSPSNYSALYLFYICVIYSFVFIDTGSLKNCQSNCYFRFATYNRFLLLLLCSDYFYYNKVRIEIYLES